MFHTWNFVLFSADLTVQSDLNSLYVDQSGFEITQTGLLLPLKCWCWSPCHDHQANIYFIEFFFSEMMFNKCVLNLGNYSSPLSFFPLHFLYN